jgi:hypothetical protein
MAIYLNSLTFTDQDDIVPPSGAEPISMLYTSTVNTLAGDDIINGSNGVSTEESIYEYSFINFGGTLNTNDGNDVITGIFNQNEYTRGYLNSGNSGIANIGSFDEGVYATINTGDGNDTITGISNFLSGDLFANYGIYNVIGTIDTGDGNDIITGIGHTYGILTEVTTIDTGNGDDIITAIGGDTGIDSRVNTTINTGDGNDTITATSDGGFGILLLSGTIDTGEGNDIINGTGENGLVFNTADFSFRKSRINTGEGDDIITGTGSNYDGIRSDYIDTGNGDDIITGTGSQGGIRSDYINTGNGDDTISGTGSQRGIENFNTIETGEGNDIITSTGVIYNEGVINTGDDNDSIIVDATGSEYGIYNNGGAIITGNGNDSIIANEGFESAPNSSGAWFLGEGDDYIKGYGSGDFYGGNGNDTLELTPGTYTVGIWGEGGESPIFTKGGQLMITSEFEKLKVGSTIYDFTTLTAGQIIVVF